jgi:hypothetical protein
MVKIQADASRYLDPFAFFMPRALADDCTERQAYNPIKIFPIP